MIETTETLEKLRHPHKPWPEVTFDERCHPYDLGPQAGTNHRWLVWWVERIRNATAGEGCQAADWWPSLKKYLPCPKIGLDNETRYCYRHKSLSKREARQQIDPAIPTT